MTNAPNPLPFTCEKRPATGALGVVVTNSPLGSAAGSEMLAAGGNAIDAAVAALFTLTVVEPMMVGIAGGGMSHPRLADGRHVIIDAMSTAGRAARNSDMYEPLTGMEVAGRKNTIGPAAVAVAGNLGGLVPDAGTLWQAALRRCDRASHPRRVTRVSGQPLSARRATRARSRSAGRSRNRGPADARRRAGSGGDAAGDGRLCRQPAPDPATGCRGPSRRRSGPGACGPAV